MQLGSAWSYDNWTVRYSSNTPFDMVEYSLVRLEASPMLYEVPLEEATGDVEPVEHVYRLH